MAQIDNIEQSFTAINKTLDRIEARVDNMSRMLDEIVGEIDKHKNGPSKTITTTYDGEIMYRYKQNNK
jgi:hypothetical protein